MNKKNKRKSDDCCDSELPAIEFNSCGNVLRDAPKQYSYKDSYMYENGELFGKILSMNSGKYTIERISKNKYIDGTVQVLYSTSFNPRLN